MISIYGSSSTLTFNQGFRNDSCNMAAADRTERKRWEKERQKTKELRRRTKTNQESKRLSYIKFRADIKNQRRKCCIRDAPKIRQKEKREKKSLNSELIFWIRWYKISFLAPEVYCGSLQRRRSQRFCSFYRSTTLFTT